MQWKWQISPNPADSGYCLEFENLLDGTFAHAAHTSKINKKMNVTILNENLKVQTFTKQML